MKPTKPVFFLPKPQVMLKIQGKYAPDGAANEWKENYGFSVAVMTSFHSRIAAESDTDHRGETFPQTQASRNTSRKRPTGLSDSSLGIWPHEAQNRISGKLLCDMNL